MPLTVSSPWLQSLDEDRKRQERLSQASLGASKSAVDALAGMQDLALKQGHLDQEAAKLKADAAQRAIENERADKTYTLQLQGAERAKAKDDAETKTSAAKEARLRLAGVVRAGLAEGLDDRGLIERAAGSPDVASAGIDWTEVSAEANRQRDEAQKRALDEQLKKSQIEKNVRGDPFAAIRTENMLLTNEKLKRDLSNVPESDRKALSDMYAAEGSLDELINAVAEQGTGPLQAMKNIGGRLPLVGDTIDPGAKARSLYDDLESFKSAELKRLSGAGVSEGERAAFNRFNASIGDTTTTALAALARYKRDLAREREARLSLLPGGDLPADRTTPPAASAATPRPTPPNASASDTVVVTNGKETLQIPRSDLAAAQADGFRVKE